MTRTMRIRFLALGATGLALAPVVRSQCEVEKLSPSSPVTRYFGYSVALAGEFGVVGAPWDDTFAPQGGGGAYLYRSTGSGWVEVAHFFGDDPEPDGQDEFGTAVALSGDTMLVGAPQGFAHSGLQGSVFVYEYDGASWNQTARLAPFDASVEHMFFGVSVAIDGDRALVGAYGGNGYAGSAYVFERSGSVWTETAWLTASDAEVPDSFGWSVALEGDRALVGAHTEGSGSSYGAVYAFEHATTWNEVAKLTPSDPTPGKFFGSSVALSDMLAVIGAIGDDSIGQATGAAYVFEWSGSTWVETKKILAPDQTENDVFGSSVALNDSRVLVGASADGAGSVYASRRQGSDWVHEAKLLASDGTISDNLGFSVAMQGDLVLAGAPNLSQNGPGKAYFFQIPSFASSYCFGSTCPCANDSPAYGGCANSVLGNDDEPQGARIGACGTASVAADDLVLELTHLPPNKFGLFYMGGGQTQAPFGDGLRCVDTGGIGIFRYNPPQNSGAVGMLALGPGIVARSHSFATGGHIDPGETWYFQGWYRDPMGSCGAAFNLSNGIAVTFEP